MKFKDQFTITLNSEQHALLNECLSGVASLDLPPSLDDNFDNLWENVIECDHKIVEDAWAQFPNSIQVCWIRVTQNEKSVSLPKDISSESPQIGFTEPTKNIWILCTIFSMDSKSFQDDQDYTFLVTVTANDLEEAERQVPFDSILYAVNGDTRF